MDKGPRFLIVSLGGRESRHADHPVAGDRGAAGIDEVAAWEQSIILLEENSLPFGIVADGVMRMVSLDEPAAAPEKVRALIRRVSRGSLTKKIKKS